MKKIILTIFSLIILPGAWLVARAAEPVFTLSSPSFQQGTIIPDRFTCEGKGGSPYLQWANVPEQTASFALIMEDPDAPGGTWTHWIIFNLPASARDLKGSFSTRQFILPGIKQGRNDFKDIGYGGPCPPPGSSHQYIFKLYALDSVLDLAGGCSKDDLLQALEGHVKATATLTGIFQRR